MFITIAYLLKQFFHIAFINLIINYILLIINYLRNNPC